MNNDSWDQRKSCRSTNKSINKMRATSLTKSTIPVSDLLNQTPLFPILHDIFMQVRSAKTQKKIDTVKLHKERLGNETISSSSSLIWDKKLYIVAVSNTSGVHLEVSSDASLETAKAAIETYIRDMELPINVDRYTRT